MILDWSFWQLKDQLQIDPLLSPTIVLAVNPTMAFVAICHSPRQALRKGLCYVFTDIFTEIIQNIDG